MHRLLAHARNICVCVASVLVLGAVPRVSYAQQPPSIEDITAAIRHSADAISDYKADCHTTQKWLYKSVASTAEVGLGERTPPKIIRWEKKPDNEPLKALRTHYSWLEKGAKLAGEFRVDDETGIPGSYNTKYAFDGERYLALTTSGDSLSGSINGLSARNRHLSELILTPDHLFSYFEERPLLDWLSDPNGTATVTYTEYDGRQCILVDYVNKNAVFSRATFLLDPAKGFAPVVMGSYGQSGKLLDVYKTTEFVEAVSGTWLPLKGVHEYYFADPADSEDQVVYCVAEFELDAKTLEVNTDIPDSAFTFAFPQRTVLANLITNEFTVVGGESLKPEDSVDDFISKAQTRPGTSLEIRTPPLQTVSTPVVLPKPFQQRSSRRWLLIIGCAVFVLLGVFAGAVLRSRKKRGTDAK